MDARWTENDLEQLRKFLYGEGEFSFIGGALTTYPNGDERTKLLYAGCCELEGRGLVARRELSSDVVIFKKVDELEAQ